jgi:PAS domain S-box-containing protein
MLTIPLLWRLPIKGKLILITMATTVTVLLLAAGAFSIHEHVRARRSIVRDTSSLARLLANRSTAALLFDDPAMCAENLAALRGIPTIQGAAIFREDGRPIATYRSVGTAGIRLPSGASHRFEGAALVVFEPILLEDRAIGTLYIRTGLDELRVMSRHYLLSALLILALGSLVALLLSSGLQKIVSGPISRLTETARRVAQDQDYSLRASRVYDDELGVLVEAFNGMLAQIQDRGLRLQAANERLESQVQARTTELRAASEQLGGIFETASSGIVLTQERRIVRCNRELEAIFGYGPGEMLGQTTRIWYPDEATFEAIGQEIAACTARGEIFSRELQLVRKDGGLFWSRMKLQATDRSDLSRGIVGVLEDVTPEREHAESLNRALEAAKAADQIKSAFLATMSHELRTPLNSIIGFTGILLQGLVGELNPEQKKQLGMVRDSSTHLLELINDVLDLSKIEAGQLKLSREDFDLRASIERTVQITRPLAEKKGLELIFEEPGEIPHLESDRRRVEQILLNLLSNAIKFTERGSVSVECHPEADRVSLRVRDTGIGLGPEEMERLFKPFSQIDSSLTRKYEGTGLGLSICKRLVELMGGEIWVESHPGEGSTFAFTLPWR